MQQHSIFRFEFQAMGTLCELQLFAVDEHSAQRISQRVIADVRSLERAYSRYQPDSLLSRINQVAASGGELEVDETTTALLNYAQTCYELSDGLFDISSGLLRQIWRFEEQRLPTQAALDAVLERIGWHKLSWQAPCLRFDTPGMELDFGGIVKEYAADRAAQLCLDAGVVSGVVNLGGDIKIIGPRLDGRSWRIGLGHPQAQSPITLGLQQGAVASSGDYQRFMEVDGVRYSHILNPKTGWPVRYLSAVSVVGDFCVVAGSASTIAMLKEADGPAWLDAMGLPYLWIDAQGQVGGPLSQ